MPDCQNCGAHVSKKFVRVIGTNDDQTHACPSCHVTMNLLEPNIAFQE